MSTGSQNKLSSLSVHPFLEQLSGRSKGKIFELSGDKLTIGRQDNNDLVVQAEGVSRQHAMIVRSHDGAWYIRDNQSRNGVLINGKVIREAWLKSGDVIQLGAFVFRFHSGSGMLESAPPKGEIAPAAALPPSGIETPVSAPKRGLNKRILIYGGAGLVLAIVLILNAGGGEGDKKPTDGDATQVQGKALRDFKVAEEPKLESAKDPNTVVGIEDPMFKSAEQEMAKLDWTNSSLKEAEQFFRRGQREYLDKNYHRAIDDFQTALSLYRGHVLADQYLRRAIYELEILAKKHMELGIQYFDALQYRRAIYHFTEVVNLMSHRPAEPIVGEAEHYIQQAKRRLEAAELFP